MPFYDKGGAFQGYRGVSVDVTAQVFAERALRDSEARMRHSQQHLERAQRVAATGSAERDLVTGAEEWSDEMFRCSAWSGRRSRSPARSSSFAAPGDSRLQPQADFGEAPVRSGGNSARGLAHAARQPAGDGADRRARHRSPELLRRRRPVASGHGQLGHQRGACDRHGDGHHHHRVEAGRQRCRRLRFCQRHRLRHGRRHGGTHLRSLPHHQGRGAGNRPRPIVRNLSAADGASGAQEHRRGARGKIPKHSRGPGDEPRREEGPRYRRPRALGARSRSTPAPVVPQAARPTLGATRSAMAGPGACAGSAAAMVAASLSRR